MTVYKLSEMPRWATKVRRVQEAIVKTSTSNLIADIEVVPGINRGGSRVKGTIPRDFGILANSLKTELYGSTGMTRTGRRSHTLIAGAMKAGDIARFSWGGDVAPYAYAVHEGTDSLPGTHWIDVAAAKWDSYVRAAVAKAKMELG